MRCPPLRNISNGSGFVFTEFDMRINLGFCICLFGFWVCCHPCDRPVVQGSYNEKYSIHKYCIMIFLTWEKCLVRLKLKHSKDLFFMLNIFSEVNTKGCVN